MRSRETDIPDSEVTTAYNIFLVLLLITLICWIIGTSIVADDLPGLLSAKKTATLIWGVGWLIASTCLWFVIIWWYGIFKGWHPWSGLGWRKDLGIYLCIIVGFPGFVIVSGTACLFYAAYGLVLGSLAIKRHFRTQSMVLHQQQQQQSREQEMNQRQSKVEAEIEQALAGRDAAMQKFFDEVLYGKRRLVETARQDVDNKVAQFESAERELMLARVRLTTAEELSRARDDQREPEDIWGGLEKHPCVRALKVTADNCLYIYLKTIFIVDLGRKYEIGDFVLWCQITGVRFGVQCLRSTNKNSYHPFWYQNSICFGDAGYELERFLLAGQFYAFVNLANQMMTNPSQSTLTAQWKEVQ